MKPIRKNPFIDIYRKCNTGSPTKKYEAIINGNKTALPEYMDIELTNYCNFHCMMCPCGTGAMKREQGFMSDEVMDRLIEDVEKYKIKGVRLIGWGEPTLHPKFMIMLERLKNTGTLVHFNTNGSILSKNDWEKIVDLKIDSMKFSFQGTDKTSYEEMRKGGDFTHLLQALQWLDEARKEKEKPYVQISTTITNETVEQVKEFEELIKNYCDYYNIGRTKLSHIDVNDMTITEKEKEQYLKLRQQETNDKIFTKSCTEPFEKLSMGWNGELMMCCADYNHETGIGNIKDSSLIILNHNEKAMEFREMISNGKFEHFDVCKKCYGFMELTT